MTDALSSPPEALEPPNVFNIDNFIDNFMDNVPDSAGAPTEMDFNTAYMRTLGRGLTNQPPVA